MIHRKEILRWSLEEEVLLPQIISLFWPSIFVILTITSPHCQPIFIILMSPHYQIILPLKSTVLTLLPITTTSVRVSTTLRLSVHNTLGPFLWKHLRNSIIASQINPSVSFYISIYKKVALDDATCGHKWCPPTVGLKPELKPRDFNSSAWNSETVHSKKVTFLNGII